MKKLKVTNIAIIALAIGFYVSYYFTGFIALPIVAGLFIGERFINPLIFKNKDGK
tara:strand:+ start:940 stop:1104 length:165 start_codon:yes stop_codon:yes gene_type:complete